MTSIVKEKNTLVPVLRSVIPNLIEKFKATLNQIGPDLVARKTMSKVSTGSTLQGSVQLVTRQD